MSQARFAFPRAARAVLAALWLVVAMVPVLRAQRATPTPPRPTAAQLSAIPPRAVRRDVPITNSIRRAFAAGTRDSTGRPGRNYWQLRTDYAIDVSLNPSTSRLSGRARITIRNSSPDPLSNIGLRLDPNHFLGNAPHAAPWVPAEVTDGMVISRMTINGTPVNLASNATPAGDGGSGARAIVAAQQSAANALTGEAVLLNGRSTAASIRLATPIAAGASALLDIAWSHKLPGGPGTGHRMVQRWADTLYQPTQWFPRVAVYDDLRGWDSELYVGPSEFYNNFGSFDVNIDVPAGWIVSGTGVLQNPTDVLTAKARAQLDLKQPPIDFVQLGRSMGVPSVRADTAAGFVDALERAFNTPGPHLIEAMVPSAFSGLKLRVLPRLLAALENMPQPVARAIKRKVAP
jgi:hypothetical protein